MILRTPLEPVRIYLILDSLHVVLTSVGHVMRTRVRAKGIASLVEAV